MRSEMLSQEKNVVTIKAVVEKEDFKKEVSKMYDKLAKNAAIPGFRRGKAPRKVLDLRFGKEAILAEALEEMIPSLLGEITTDYDLNLIEDPDVKIDVIEEGKDVELTLVFEVEPEVSLADLSEILVVKPKINVTDDHVAEAIEDLRKRHASLETVDRPSASGDVVVADYSTVVVDDDGEEIVSHPAETHSFDLVEETLRPEIYQTLVGVSPEDERESQVVIDEDYKDEKLAGKTAKYKFTVKEVKERVLPDLDSSFFVQVFGEEGEAMDEETFRESISQRLGEHMEGEAQQAAEGDMVRKSVDASEVEVPVSMVNRQVENLKKRMEEQGAAGVDDSQLTSQAERDVKEFLVLEAYGKDLAVELTKEDLDEEFQRVADGYGIGVEAVKEAFLKNKDKINEIAHSLKVKKTISAMMEKVTVEEKELGQAQ
ncbi:trigger factor [Dethiosulfovibrio peptidovorans]|nr:trigger factor [Dethiosulfovibrio peptidovorans]